jgi:heme/copper-type cytochrome/quinol oxidase subunit 2
MTTLSWIIIGFVVWLLPAIFVICLFRYAKEEE